MKKSIVAFSLILIFMYVLSLALLAGLAAVLWKWGADSQRISGCVIGIYVIVNFVGGLLIGKVRGRQKLFWGCGLGLCYFGLLVLVGYWTVGTTFAGNNWIYAGALVCGVTGMLGGMLAPAKG